MFEVASQIIICLILAALLGWIIGYLMGKATCAKNRDCHETKKGSHELHIDNNHDNTNSEATPLMSETKEVGKQPVLLTAPRNGKKDNLQLIKGVGGVLESLLNEIGIYHFDQIANLTKEEILWLDNSMSFPGRIEREEWVIQAKKLANGEITEFAKRVERGEIPTSKKS
jgi:predicted flap endonuclease-1-like 5' DNA nuclease